MQKNRKSQVNTNTQGEGTGSGLPIPWANPQIRLTLADPAAIGIEAMHPVRWIVVAYIIPDIGHFGA